MKKILFTAVAFTIMSCSKENSSPNNCGLILSDDVHDYSVLIRNGKTGNEKKFYLHEGDWMNAHPGTTYCITNSTGW